MNIYDAIMKAADHIERHPGDFEFMATKVPRSCGSPGCALGWIGFFFGMRNVDFLAVAREALSLPAEAPHYAAPHLRPDVDFAFYNRMDGLFGGMYWRYDAAACAATLRLYAAKYHGDEKPVERNFARELYAKVSTQRLEETA